MARIGFMASKEMLFENVDNDDGQTDDRCLAILKGVKKVRSAIKLFFF